MSSANQFPGAPRRNFYGRTHGKQLRPAQRRYLDEDLPRLTVHGVEWEENPDRAPLDLKTIFEGRPVWLEIGFGGGEHLAAMARRYPDIGFIGCEPFVNGIAMLLGKLREGGQQNVRLHPGDARNLFDVLPEGSIERAFLNYPDPWPKARHHRRRFVTEEHLLPLRRAMAPGAMLRVATDIEDYVRQTLEEVPQAGFTRVEHDIGTAWEDWPSTRYEQKALREGRRPHYMSFLR
ncbi:tRNA (guanine(46)-N(7))-methyltransferase TrmB [Pseudoroseicyclus aestuarii]|uniref:tRNA (guanine-N(7)-)-methyltransferase n=1 Tax=Pseudoroseicyclus aestuarii TaxID=1795041 RepID=A0A318SUR6_9RHOB|nr:tRNA (guanine(46)-N(7))-methyltransferase TrmB [Pseudoroseicyclus aestuarii]PYE84069.1 tRNA (guanine-N(7)-)-methyltransferase [Pseudoroseicyclus aestuarii]